MVGLIFLLKNSFIVVIILIFIILVVISFSGTKPVISNPEIQNPSEKASTYSFIHISDTQSLSQDYPEVLNQIFSTIESKKDEYNIKAIVNTGDLVDNWNDSIQWKRYTDARNLTTIPVYEIAGNHDINSQKNDYDYTEFLKETNLQSPFWSSTFENFIILGISYARSDISYENINTLKVEISKNPDKIPLIAIHEYMDERGNRQSIGNQVSQNLILRPSIILSGHWGANYINIRSYNNSPVIEDITNYQWFGNYSAMRLYTVYSSEGAVDQITVRTIRVNPSVKIEPERLVYSRSQEVHLGVQYADYIVKFDPRGHLLAGTISGPAPLSVNFFPLSLESPDMKCEWNFGDGTPRSSQCSITHTYSKPGNYSPGLSVSTNEGSYQYARSRIIQVT
jgi:predicted MPP superfamily phosphohydrolase